IFPQIAAFQRFLTGFIPFAFGDILYTIAIIYLLVKLFKTIRLLFQRKLKWPYFFLRLSCYLKAVFGIYLIFLLAWGLNYDRLGIGYQTHLVPAVYSAEDLKMVTNELVEKMNADRRMMGSEYQYQTNREIFNTSKRAYQTASDSFPFLAYKKLNIKSSLYSRLSNYMGVTGYYNPFTGEANVNVWVPRVYIPYVTCHEVGHQLGYAKESEASFAGFLAGRVSNDEAMRYSTYFDLFSYANRQLYNVDSAAAHNNYRHLDTLIKKDIREIREFNRRNRNAVEPYLRLIYGKYLQLNSQPTGMLAYDEVVGWVVAYWKKYGKI
ncbi:MAG: hypothetical protein JWN76_2173, partial [Chitinophagaceae bacterium]|nr:hypothetical protein [Chitinophagaceae bacterium]